MTTNHEFAWTKQSTSTYWTLGLTAALSVALLLIAMSVGGAPDLASYGGTYP